MQRFILNKFFPQYKTTIGSDFSSKEVKVNDQTMTLQVVRVLKPRSGTQRDRRDIRVSEWPSTKEPSAVCWCMT